MPGNQKNRWDLLKRAKNGTFADWRGGRDMSYHGLRVHIGKEFKRQHGRPAKTGEAVRRKIKSGDFHKNSVWWVRTPDGWRRSPTNTRKPKQAEIKSLISRTRPGRGK